MDKEYNNPQVETEERLFEISVLDFWDAFKKCWWIMLISAIVVVSGFITMAKLTYTPRYCSTSTLYILFEERTQDNLTSAYTLAKSLVSDCEYAVKSQPCIQETVTKLNEDGYNCSYSTLSNNIFTKNPEDTRYITVTVNADSPENAKAYVDALCMTCQKQMAKAANGNQQVNIYSEGSLNKSPFNDVVETSYIKYGIFVMIVIYLGFVLFKIFDDKFRDDDDIEKTLGITILGTLPNADHSHGGKYAKYGKYSKYGKYGKYSMSDGKVYNKSYGYYYGKQNNQAVIADKPDIVSNADKQNTQIKKGDENDG